MILRIASKEWLNNIVTPKFITGFVLCLLLIPFSIVISINDYKSKMHVYAIEKAKADEENKAKAYSAYRPVIIKKPTSLSIFARGISYNVGNRVKVLFGDKPMLTEGKAESRDNPFLNRFFTFDFVSVLVIIMSLMAFLFTYDICTGERESGTMKMMLANPVSRSAILMGKLLGTFLTLVPMLIFSFGLCLLVIMLHPEISFSASEWIRIGVMILFSAVFLILFMIIGLFVSSRVRHSATSIVVCLIVWVVFLFVIPNVASYSAKSFISVGSSENLEYDINSIEKEFQDKSAEFSQKQPQPDWGVVSYYQGGSDGFKLIGEATKSLMERERRINEYSEPLRVQYADKKWPFRERYLHELEKQQKLAEYLSFLSPSEIFKESASALSGTNYESHNNFLKQTRNYRDLLIDNYLKNKLFGSFSYFTQIDPGSFMTADELINYRSNGIFKTLSEFNTESHGDWKYLSKSNPNSNVFEWKPIDISGLPQFQYQSLNVLTDISNSLIYIGVLLGIGIILFWLSFLSFIRYDVR
jgi:ABC-type transport system involved in multi-copper enzyme maturation permease subunit